MAFEPYNKKNRERLQNAANKPQAVRGRGNVSTANSSNSRKLLTIVNDVNLQKLTAPYNFVPLNDVVLKSGVAAKVNDDTTEIKAYKDYLTSDATKYNGYFSVEIKNLTPLFIDNGKHEFFSDGENICIPGSSLRGCIKNYFKIITNGTMRTGDDPDVTDRLLYYRIIALDTKKHQIIAPSAMELSNEYKAEMKVKVDGRVKDKSEAGFLVREGKEYFICPASFVRCKYARNEINIKNGRRGEPIVQARTNGKVVWRNDSVAVYTGKMDNKMHYYVISKPDWSKKIIIPEKVMASYRDDKKAKGIRLLDNKGMCKSGSDSERILRGAEAYDYIMPCFYVADDDIVRHFGHCPLYRIPYKLSIGKHIPANINADKLDFTAVMFGNKDSWSSRVFFENLYLQNDAGKEKEAFMIPLMGANPTSFQNYLEAIDQYNAYHWNEEDAKIRGYKMYWHRRCDWRRPADATNKNENVTKKISPLKKDCSFVGRVRFENLSGEELGALVKVLSLGDNGKAAYKLGMGKPIGMGSVELSCKLYLQDNDYYTKLFGTSGFDAGLQEQDKNIFVTAFDNYMKNSLSADSLRTYKAKMQELEFIMNKGYIDQEDWPSKTDYMDINDPEAKKIMNHRIPLPSIKDVVKKK